MAWGGCGGVVIMEVSDDLGGIGQVVSWKPFIVGVWPALELYEVV